MADDQAQLFADIKAGRFEMDPVYWGSISAPAQDLVRRLIVVNPAKRLTAEQIMSHPWIALDNAQIPNAHLTATMEKMKKFVARRRLKKAIEAVRLTVRMKLLMAGTAAARARARGEDTQAAFFAAAQRESVRPQFDAAVANGEIEFPSALMAGGRGRARVAGLGLPTVQGGGGGGRR